MSDFFQYMQNYGRSHYRGGSANGLYGLYNYLYDNANGGNRYALSQVPIFGWAKQFEDTAKRYQDYFENTGRNPTYSSQFGSISANSLGGIASAGIQPVRMARSIGNLYGCDVKENFDHKMKLARTYRETSENWMAYANLKAKYQW